jgi:uncharacterized protein
VTGVLIDTGAWIALLNRRDRLHTRAANHYEGLTASRARLTTTNYVVDETATRLRYDIGLHAALAFRRAVVELSERERLQMVWIDPRLESEAWSLLEEFADVTLSLTDATTAVVARRRRIRTIFGFDADFRALGLAVEPAS